MVAERTVAALARRERTEPPTGVKVGAGQVRRYRGGVAPTNDPAPQGVALVGADGVHGALQAVEGKGVCHSVGDPKRGLEAVAETPGVLLEAPREYGVA